MAKCAIICHLNTRGFNLYTNAYLAHPIFVKYGINTGSIRKKTGSHKNERNKPSPVSIPFPYFPVNTETVGSNIENSTSRDGIFSVRFQPY
jgi:hypothetical protein